MSLANANLDALYVSELKYHISFSSNFTLYKWFVTKVAHCILEASLIWAQKVFASTRYSYISQQC